MQRRVVLRVRKRLCESHGIDKRGNLCQGTRALGAVSEGKDCRLGAIRNTMENAMKLPKGLTWQKVMAACHRRNTTLDNPGFCLACGNEQDGCEPDAHNYECEACGERQVFGSDAILMNIM